MSDTWAADVAEETRLAQGLPLTVEDESALDRLAILLTSAAPRPASSSAGRGTGAAGPSPRATELRGSGSTAARAPKGASARRSNKKKAAVAATTTASRDASTPADGVQETA